MSAVPQAPSSPAPSATTDSAPAPAAPLLEGIRVLELGAFIAAPFATRLLSDFGAEVIKIEAPGTGDELRGWRRQRGDTSMLFRTMARNKRSLTVNLRTEEGQQIVRELAAQVDVIVENFRPGTLERWGIAPEDLQETNPDLVVVRISGYGQTGPYRDRAGFGGVAEAFGGLRYVTGYPDRDPVRPAAPVADSLAGLYAAFGAVVQLLALRRGHVQEGPRVVDVALYEAVYQLMESLVPDYDAYGTVRERTAGNLPGVVPSGSYPTGDGRAVIISGNSSKSFARLMELCGRPDLAEDPTLRDGDARSAREDELDAVVRDWTTGRTVVEAVDALAAAGVPAGPIYDAAAIAVDPHYRARGMVRALPVRVEDEIEEIRFPGVVPRIPGAEGEIRTAGPDVGADTDAVLEAIGIDAAHRAELREKGVI